VHEDLTPLPSRTNSTVPTRLSYTVPALGCAATTSLTGANSGDRAMSRNFVVHHS
jgi:hypothetical protein